jgi:hypothetical protein
MRISIPTSSSPGEATKGATFARLVTSATLRTAGWLRLVFPGSHVRCIHYSRGGMIRISLAQFQ